MSVLFTAAPTNSGRRPSRNERFSGLGLGAVLSSEFISDIGKGVLFFFPGKGTWSWLKVHSAFHGLRRREGVHWIKNRLWWRKEVGHFTERHFSIIAPFFVSTAHRALTNPWFKLLSSALIRKPRKQKLRQLQNKHKVRRRGTFFHTQVFLKLCVWRTDYRISRVHDMYMLTKRWFILRMNAHSCVCVRAHYRNWHRLSVGILNGRRVRRCSKMVGNCLCSSVWRKLRMKAVTKRTKPPKYQSSTRGNSFD